MMMAKSPLACSRPCTYAEPVSTIPPSVLLNSVVLRQITMHIAIWDRAM